MQFQLVYTGIHPIHITRTTKTYSNMQFHTHSQFEIYYFHSGKCTYLIGDRIYTLSPGDLIIMHGMTLHCAKVDPSYVYDRTTIHFDPSYIQQLIRPPYSINVLKPFQDLQNHRIHLEGDSRIEFEHMIQKLSSLSTQGDLLTNHRYLLVFLDLLHYLYELSQKPMERTPLYSSAKERSVQEIITFIEHNYQSEIHLDQIEEHLHISKNYLSNTFREVTGTTIFQYLTQRRINQAKTLFLMEQKKSVTDISYRVGFKHPAHFSRVFKHIVGCTADEYRRSLS
jgi:AraC-like DNA-binding protein